MNMNPIEQLRSLPSRLGSLDQALFRREVVIPFLVGRLLLMAAMIYFFILASQALYLD
jgi:hypothetical protein